MRDRDRERETEDRERQTDRLCKRQREKDRQTETERVGEKEMKRVCKKYMLQTIKKHHFIICKECSSPDGRTFASSSSPSPESPPPAGPSFLLATRFNEFSAPPLSAGRGREVAKRVCERAIDRDRER